MVSGWLVGEHGDVQKDFPSQKHTELVLGTTIYGTLWNIPNIQVFDDSSDFEMILMNFVLNRLESSHVGAALAGVYAQYGSDDHSNIPRFDPSTWNDVQATNKNV